MPTRETANVNGLVHVVRQMAEAVKYLHSLSIVHRPRLRVNRLCDCRWFVCHIYKSAEVTSSQRISWQTKSLQNLASDYKHKNSLFLNGWICCLPRGSSMPCRSGRLRFSLQDYRANSLGRPGRTFRVELWDLDRWLGKTVRLSKKLGW